MKNVFFLAILAVLGLLIRAVRRIACICCKPLLKSCGENVLFDPISSTFSYKSISLGSNVFIGGRAWFSCAFGEIVIGSHVMFGPGVMLLGGNHRFQCIGKTMFDDGNKTIGEDPGIIIGSDVWIGANAVLLSGVTVGDGSIVGAGAVVTKSVPPFSIVVGVPATVIGQRFDHQGIEKHINSIDKNYGLILKAD